MRIRSIDMRSDPGVELVHQPSDRAARWPLPVVLLAPARLMVFAPVYARIHLLN